MENANRERNYVWLVGERKRLTSGKRQRVVSCVIVGELSAIDPRLIEFFPCRIVRRKRAGNFRVGHFRVSCCGRNGQLIRSPYVHRESQRRVTDGNDRSVSRVDIKLDIITKLPGPACLNDSFHAGDRDIRIHRWFLCFPLSRPLAPVINDRQGTTACTWILLNDPLFGISRRYNRCMVNKNIHGD